MEKTLTLTKFYIRLVEGVIVENIARYGEVIDLNDVKLLVETNYEFVGKQKYAALVDSEQMSRVTHEAMNYSTSRETSPHTIARALMIDSLPNRIVGNFYLNIKKPNIPTKLFTKKEEAIEWLREKVKEHKQKHQQTNQSSLLSI